MELLSESISLKDQRFMLFLYFRLMKRNGEIMQYIVSFLEGIITFISPCLLPMLPIYISYFSGGGDRKPSETLKSACGFVCGFTIVFVAMGALAASVGGFLVSHRTLLNVICGLIVIFFGLVYLGVCKINLFRGGRLRAETKDLGFFSSLLFGLVFSVSWTPCVGTFLGSALMLASQQGTVLKGIALLLCYSAGLGVPFVISALIIDKLRRTFDQIKKHYRQINIVCGVFLIVVGLLMASGLLGRFLVNIS